MLLFHMHRLMERLESKEQREICTNNHMFKREIWDKYNKHNSITSLYKRSYMQKTQKIRVDKYQSNLLRINHLKQKLGHL